MNRHSIQANLSIMTTTNSIKVVSTNSLLSNTGCLYHRFDCQILQLFFRAGMFVVGPESAGAHPGPVCYKKGEWEEGGYGSRRVSGREGSMVQEG